MSESVDGEYAEGQDKAVGDIVKFVATWSNDPDQELGEVVFLLFRQTVGDEVAIGDGYNHVVGESEEELAQEIWDDASEDAMTRRGKSKYIVRPRGIRSNARGKRCPFEVRVPSNVGPGGDFEDADGLEEPTVRGQIGQAQRHTEKAYAQLIGAVNLTDQRIQRILDQQERKIEKLEKRCEEYQIREQEVLDLQAERELKYKEFEAQQRQREQAIQILGSLVPLLVQHYMMQSSSAQNAEAVAKLKTFAGTLTPDQKRALLFVLPAGEQQNALVDMLTAAGSGASPPSMMEGFLSAMAGGMMGGSGGSAPSNGSPPTPGLSGG